MVMHNAQNSQIESYMSYLKFLLKYTVCVECFNLYSGWRCPHGPILAYIFIRSLENRTTSSVLRSDVLTIRSRRPCGTAYFVITFGKFDAPQLFSKWAPKTGYHGRFKLKKRSFLVFLVIFPKCNCAINRPACSLTFSSETYRQHIWSIHPIVQ